MGLPLCRSPEQALLKGAIHRDGMGWDPFTLLSSLPPGTSRHVSREGMTLFSPCPSDSHLLKVSVQARGWYTQDASRRKGK